MPGMRGPGYPEWVLIGSRLQDGSAHLIGSRQIVKAEITMNHNHLSGPLFGRFSSPVPAYIPDPVVELSCELRRFSMLAGENFEELLASLQEQWSR